MPCACNSKDKNKSAAKFNVLKANGSIYKTYGNKAEADAAAIRIGGKVKAA